MARKRHSLLQLVIGLEELVRELKLGEDEKALAEAVCVWYISSPDQWLVLVDHADFLGVLITLGIGNKPIAMEKH